jgi:hypothetical protein
MSPMFERPIYRVRTLEASAANEPEAGQAAPLTNSAAAQPEQRGAPPRKSTARPSSFNTPFESLAGILKDGDQ